jgi:hypothetical protein
VQNVLGAKRKDVFTGMQNRKSHLDKKVPEPSPERRILSHEYNKTMAILIAFTSFSFPS